MVKKIVVCTAWGSPFSWTHAAYNMMNLTRPPGVDVMFTPGYGWCPARRHMYGVERALEWGASHVCFLGGDQVHELDILVKFTDHLESGYKVVTALVNSRGRVNEDQKPFQSNAWKQEEDKFVRIDKEDNPLQEIDTIGSGALIFDIGLLSSLKKPWFEEAVIDKDCNRVTTMDTRFVWRLRNEAKAKILCDCSIGTKHLEVFGIDDSFSERFSDWPVATKDNKTEMLNLMYQL